MTPRPASPETCAPETVAPGRLDADLVATAVVAAANAYGDDPQAVVTAPRCSKLRRALCAAASGLLEATALPLSEICRPLGVLPTAVSAARGRRAGVFAPASDAAETAVLGLLRVRGAANAVRAASARAPARPVDPAVTQLVGGSDGTTAPAVMRDTSKAAVRVAQAAAQAPALQASAPLPPVKARMAAPSVSTPLDRLPEGAALTPPSPRSGSRTAGKPADPARVKRRSRAPQADLPRRDEDRRAENAEIRQVYALREKNTPWAHVARQIGKSIPDTRRRYDPEWRDA